MGVQQNTMWQQPPPQASSTNPFAAPSGPSVRGFLLFSFLFLHNQLLFVVGYFFLSSSLLPTYICSVFFFSLFSYLCASVKRAQSLIYFFLSPSLFLPRSRAVRRQTTQIRFICIHLHFLRSFPSLRQSSEHRYPQFQTSHLTKEKYVTADEAVTCLSHLHYSLRLSSVHMCFHSQLNGHILTEKETGKQHSNTKHKLQKASCAHRHTEFSCSDVSLHCVCVCVRAHEHRSPSPFPCASLLFFALTTVSHSISSA